MEIQRRHYSPLADFEPVRQFLIRLNKPYGEGGAAVEPAGWEYLHTHSYNPFTCLPRNGIWECAGEIVAVVHLEMQLGQAVFEVDPQYSFLKEEMLDYAEEFLAETDGEGNRRLEVLFLHERDAELRGLLRQRGYEQVGTEWIGYYEIAKGIPEVPLPGGFSIVDLTQENDLQKIKQVLWLGFNHEGEPHKGVDKERLMQAGPRFNPKLTTIVKAPDGEYAVYCGMWYQPEIREAYLEPLCAHPAYRRMGLAKAALYESMRRTRALGALTCVAGGQPFYEKVGFQPHHNLETWAKTFT